MRIQPDGADLLGIVDQLLRDEIMPLLPAEKVYEIRMALNAMGIARRQLEIGDELENVEAETLQVVVEEPARSEGDTLAHRFARMVRAGQADDDEGLQTLLWAQTVNRVRESAPRYLRQEGMDY